MRARICAFSTTCGDWTNEEPPYLVLEKNRKKGKLGLDKHLSVWYNKSCVEREYIEQSASILENDTVNKVNQGLDRKIETKQTVRF